MEINESMATFQPNGLLQQGEQWQPQDCKVVATLADGRKIRQVSEQKCEVTTYKGKPATDKEIQAQIDKLRRNYTQMKSDFFAVLINVLTKDKWTAARISDAVSHVIRTKTGGFISVADIMSYDRPMKLYTHSGYEWLISNHRATDEDACGPKSDFSILYIDKGTPQQKAFWYLKKDLPQYKQ